jgi:hypothetical protein
VGRIVFLMMQSLDGYVDGVAGGVDLPPPVVALGRHFLDHFRSLAGGYRTASLPAIGLARTRFG